MLIIAVFLTSATALENLVVGLRRLQGLDILQRRLGSHTRRGDLKHRGVRCPLSEVVVHRHLAGVGAGGGHGQAGVLSVGPGKRSALLDPHIRAGLSDGYGLQVGLLVVGAVAPVGPVVQAVQVAGVGDHVVVVLDAGGEVGDHLEVAVLGGRACAKTGQSIRHQIKQNCVKKKRRSNIQTENWQMKQPSATIKDHAVQLDNDTTVNVCSMIQYVPEPLLVSTRNSLLALSK